MPKLSVLAIVTGIAFFSGAARSQSADGFKPYPHKIAMLVISAHPDDEALWFGGTLASFPRVKHLPVIWVMMTNKGTNREPETMCAAKGYGLEYKPIMAGFQDACYQKDLACNWQAWGGRENTVRALTGLLRTYKPEVVLTHDFNGEYGHPNHMGSAASLYDAYFAAADKNRFPDQAESLGVWQPKKLYMHGSAKAYREYCKSNPDFALCKREAYCAASGFFCSFLDRPDAQITEKPAVPRVSIMRMDWTGHPAELQGKSLQDIANEGGTCHVSQGFKNNWVMSTNVFELWDSKVGADQKGGDFLENVDLSAFSNTSLMPRLSSTGDVSRSMNLRRTANLLVIEVAAFHETAPENFVARLFDAHGRQVRQALGSLGKVALGVSELREGLYTVKVSGAHWHGQKTEILPGF